MENNTEYVQQCYFTLKVIMRTNSKPLDQYIMNDSDLIEIVVAKLNGFYNSLPDRVTKKKVIHFKKNLIKVKKKTNNEEEKKQNPLKIKKIKYSNVQHETMNIRDMIQDVYSDGDMLNNFDAFSSFFTFFNELLECTINQTMVDNLVNKFFNDFLLDKIQPILLSEEDINMTRTCIQYLVHMVELASSYKIITNLFFFLFGFPEGFKPIEEDEEKQEAEYEQEKEQKHDNIDEMFNFMNDEDMVLHHGDNNDEVMFELDDDFDIIPDTDSQQLPEEEQVQDVEAPMIRIGNQMMPGPQKQLEVEQDIRGRGTKGRSNNQNTNKRGRSVSVFAVKDAKIGLDLLSSILNSVENAEKQVEQDIQKNEEEDYE